MKIVMMCGSPRGRASTSRYLLDVLAGRLQSEHEIYRCQAVGEHADAKQVVLENIGDAGALVIAFPLYVDSIPGSFLQVLRELEEPIRERVSECRLYVLVNNGFYDARQNEIAVDMAWRWCECCGLKRGRAIGLGGGEMAQAAPPGVGPSRNLGKALEQMLADIREGNSGETILTEPNFPRFLYIAAGNMGWAMQAKKNGLKRSELRKRN